MLALKLTGEFAELERFMEKVASVPDSMRIVSANLAEETIELFREGFETSTDPYGNRWEPLKLRSGQPLRDKGGLQSSWHRRFVTAQGFTVASGKDYAAYHQGGTGIYGPRHQRIVPTKARALRFAGPSGPIFARSVEGVPRRRMVPDKGALPSRWRQRYVEAAQDVLTELFK
jgi:phage gpG-like protein